MTNKIELLAVIRKRCLECCSGSFQDVEGCTSGPDAAPYSTCALWAYRLGKDPEKPSEAMQEKGRKLAEIRTQQLKETC